MRIKRNLVIVFVITFFIGVLFYFSISKFDRTNQAVLNLPQPNVILPQKIEIKVGKPMVSPEILEANNDWENTAESSFRIKLLEPGEGFHGDEIEAKSGETWVGFFEKDGKYYLRSTKLKVARVRDEVVDDEGERTGKSVRVDGNDKPLFFLKNAEMLRAGDVLNLYDGFYDDEVATKQTEEEAQQANELRSLSTGFRREFQLNGKIYTLRVASGLTKKGESIDALILESDGIKQTLHSLKGSSNGAYLGELNWIGDLDGDGRPDLHLNLHYHDNVLFRNLFMSSSAKQGKLVKRIASFSTTGC